jgi:hypothetical protein
VEEKTELVMEEDGIGVELAEDEMTEAELFLLEDEDTSVVELDR